MSTKTRSKSKRGGIKTELGFATRARILVSAAAMGVGAVSIAATMVMVPATDSVVVALSGFAVHNPLLLGVLGLFILGNSPIAGRFAKPATGGRAWVACTKCNRMFRDEAEVERHSAGYHV